MFRPEEVPALQRAAEDEVVRRSFKLVGIFSLLFGGLALFAGVVPPPDLLLLAVGAVLAFAGLWNLVMRNPTGLLLSAVSLCVVGVYNVASPFLPAAGGQGVSAGWAVLGAWQVMWGVQGYRRWQRFRGALASTTPEALRKRAADLIDGVRKANPKKDDAIVEFASAGFTPTLLRMRLGPDGVVCLIGAGDDVRICPRSEVALDVDNVFDTQPVAKAALRLGDRTWKGSLRADHVRRFRAWQTGAVALSKAA